MFRAMTNEIDGKMTKERRSEVKYKWEQNEIGDDLTCKVGEKIILRVEQMSMRGWWYQVYYANYHMFCDSNYAATKERAKQVCELIADTLLELEA